MGTGGGGEGGGEGGCKFENFRQGRVQGEGGAHREVCKGPQQTQGQLAHEREQVGGPCRKLGHIYQAQNCFPAVFD